MCIVDLMSSNKGERNSNSEVYADPRLRRPAAERAPVDAFDARAADGVPAIHKSNGF